jgi:hypothetical protein
MANMIRSKQGGYHIVTRVFSPEEQPVSSTQELCWSIKWSITKAETKKNKKNEETARSLPRVQIQLCTSQYFFTEEIAGKKKDLIVHPRSG